MRSRFAALAGALCVLLLIGCTSATLEYRRPAQNRDYAPPAQHASLKVPPGHLPPPGSCRIWYPGTPPGKQPPPGDCAVLARKVPPGAWLLSRGTVEPGYVDVSVYDERRPGVVLEVRVYDAESGVFIRMRGEAARK